MALMHWVVNTDLRRERGYEELIAALQAQGLPYTMVRKPPMADFLVAMHDDLDADGHNKPVRLDLSNPVFVTGTTSMIAVSAEHGWAPGYISAPGIVDCVRHWGAEMLNWDSQYARVDQAVPPSTPFFLRPEQDIKCFAGLVINPGDFEEWRAGVLAITSWTTIPPDTMLCMAPVKEILAEYRCIVVRGVVTTACRYKIGSRVVYTEGVPPEVSQYAEDMARVWNPRPAFCMDVAETPHGLRIIEVNSVSACGFYALDMAAFVGSISALAEEAQ